MRLRVSAYEIVVAFGMLGRDWPRVGLAVGLHRFSPKELHADHSAALRIRRTSPSCALILYFGIGPASKIAFGVSTASFRYRDGRRRRQNIKPILLTAAKSMGASRWHIFRWVIFPHMIPSLFAGMRLGMTGVLLGVLLAELYVSTPASAITSPCARTSSPEELWP